MPILILSEVMYQISHDSFGKIRRMRKFTRIRQSFSRNKLHNDFCSYIKLNDEILLPIRNRLNQFISIKLEQVN
jgi:hypothetical protein